MLAASLATGNSATGSLANMFGQNSANGNALNSAIGQGVSSLADWFKSPGPTGNANDATTNDWIQNMSSQMPSNNNFGIPGLVWD